jgi:hypothetical protein
MHIAQGVPGFHAAEQRRAPMSIELPKPIAAYFSADADADNADREVVARCFTENAVVRDEGHLYSGHAAIKQWKARSTKKYQYTSEPFASADQGGKVIITSHLVGNFPGSPLDLRYFFVLEGDKIASLEIIP